MSEGWYFTKRRTSIKSKDAILQKMMQIQGITTSVLSEISGTLKKEEDVLLCKAFQAFAISYGNQDQPGEEVDKAALQLGSVDQQILRKEQKQLHTLAAQHQKISSRLKEASQEAESIRFAAYLQTQLKQFDDLRDSGQFVKAANCIAIVAGNLTKQSQSSGTNEEALLRLEFAERGSNLAQELARQVDEAILYDSKRENEEDCYQISVQNPGSLSDIWIALQTLQEELPVLARLSQKVIKSLFKDKNLPFKVSVEALRGSKILRIGLSQSYNDGTGNKMLHESLKAILDFIGEYGLANDASLCQGLGKLLWPELASIYIDSILKNLQNKDEQNHLAFEEACRKAEILEDEVEELGFLDKDDALFPLHEYAEEALGSTLDQVKTDLVSRARNLMLQPFHETITKGLPLHTNSQSSHEDEKSVVRDSRSNEDKKLGNQIQEGNNVLALEDREDDGNDGWYCDDLHEDNDHGEIEESSLLAEGNYQVSQTAVEILEIIKKGLECSSEKRSRVLSKACILAMGEISDLYSATMPTIWMRELQVPLMAAIFHNNCLFLSEEFSLQSWYYPGLVDLPQRDLKELLHILQSLRKTGRTSLDSIADYQIGELRDILATAENFRNISEAKRGLQARKAVQQVLHALKRLGSVLKPILLPQDFINLGSKIISSPTEIALATIMRSTDISRDEKEDLPRILDPLANESTLAFSSGSKVPREQNYAASPEQIAHSLEEACRPLQRLQVVLQIMGSNLGAIRIMWEEGIIRSKGMNAQEVVRLIQALCEESDLRDAVIADILS